MVNADNEQERIDHMKFFKPSASDTGSRIAADALAKADFAKKPKATPVAQRAVTPRTDYSGHNSNIQAINEAVALGKLPQAATLSIWSMLVPSTQRRITAHRCRRWWSPGCSEP